LIPYADQVFYLEDGCLGQHAHAAESSAELRSIP
jgi:hypothetical protein